MQMKKGQLARIHGLQNRSDLNGHVCALQRFIESRERWVVNIPTTDPHENVSIRLANLEILDTKAIVKALLKLHQFEVHDVTSELQAVQDQNDGEVLHQTLVQFHSNFISAKYRIPNFDFFYLSFEPL